MSFPVEFVVLPKVTYVHFTPMMPRRIYTDGRDFPKEEEPAYMGYSIGKWLDTDGDGRYDTLEVETRDFKGPRNYEDSGLPLHLAGFSKEEWRALLGMLKRMRANGDALRTVTANNAATPD